SLKDDLINNLHKKHFPAEQRNQNLFSLPDINYIRDSMRVALLANIKPKQNVAPARWHEQFEDDTFAEWDSIETIEAVRDALASHPDVECEIVEAIPETAIPRLMVRKYDIVFNIAEGMRGASREAQFPAVMEMLGIPYTGS